MLIIGYKLVKGAVWLVLAGILLVMTRMGLGDRLAGLAEHLRHHAHAWSIYLAELVARGGSRRGLWTITLALVADGVASLVEAWALHHGRWWGPWVVVVTTSALLPFEVVALVHKATVVRAVLLALNLAIVWYLVRLVRREHARAARAVK